MHTSTPSGTSTPPPIVPICVPVTGLFQNSAIAGFVANLVMVIFMYWLIGWTKSVKACPMNGTTWFLTLLLTITILLIPVPILDGIAAFGWVDETKLEMRKKLLLYPFAYTVAVTLVMIVVIRGNWGCIDYQVHLWWASVFFACAAFSSLIFHIQCMVVPHKSS